MSLLAMTPLPGMTGPLGMTVPAMAAMPTPAMMAPSTQAAFTVSGVDAEPESKRQRLSMPHNSSASNGVVGGARTEAERAWLEQWADVFTVMYEGGLEHRAGEFAEAVVALKKSSEGLRRQLATVKESCEQMLQTGYREALQAHLKAMLEAASAGASPEITGGAGRVVEELTAAADRAAAYAASIGQLPTPQQQPVLGSTGGAAQAQAVVSQQSRFSQNSAAIASAQEDASQSNLWVGGLPEGMDNAMFRTLFGRYGDIRSITLVADQRYGFVNYASKQEAQAAMDALNGFECNGVKLSVRLAEWVAQSTALRPLAPHLLGTV